MSKILRAIRPRTLTIMMLAITLAAVPFQLPSAKSEASIGPVQAVGASIVSVFSDAYQSSNITDVNLTPGTNFTVEIRVDNAPAFNGYEFLLYYDPNYITPTSIDELTGTVFNNPFAVTKTTATPGEVKLIVVNLGSEFTGTAGTLSHITFHVNAFGASPLTLAAGLDQPSSFAQTWTRIVDGLTALETTTSDGYFKNVEDKHGPVARFTISPATPLTGENVVFDATQSFDSDSDILPSRGILRYTWDFGHGFSMTTIFPLIIHQFTIDFGGSQFDFNGNFSVRLTVTDKDNLQGIVASPVEVATTPAPSDTFDILTSNTPVTIAPGGTANAGLTITSLNNFIGIITLTTIVAPSTPDNPTTSLNPATISIGIGGTKTSTLTITTAAKTPAGKYSILIYGTSGSVVQVGQINVLVSPLEPVFLRSKVVWTRHLSLSANNNTQTWISKVTNPNLNIDLQIQIQIRANGDTGSFFQANSPLVILHGGETRIDIVTTQTFTQADIGTRFIFIAAIVWLDPVTNQLFASSTVKSGSFTVIP